MKSTQIAFSVLLVASVFSSCTKTEDVPPSNMELIGRTPWALAKVKTGTTEAVPAPCTLDNVYTFEISGTYTQDEGTSKCDPGDDQTITGKWVFSTDEKKVKLIINGLAILEKEIVELTSTSLVVKYKNGSTDIQESYAHTKN